MFNLFEGLRNLIVGVAVSAATVINPVAKIQPVPINVATISAKPSAVTSVNPSSSPLTLNNENYIYVRGTYSYLGMNAKYLFIILRNGGNYSGSIEGVCSAQANGDYEGGNGGKISGNVSGECNIFWMKYKGSTGYRGNLYPDSKKATIEIDNSPLKGPITLNYD